jgi:hypothetical protein
MKNTQKWILRLSITITLCMGLGSALVHVQIKASNQSGFVMFAGEHVGMTFEGKFERWQATLGIDRGSGLT